MPRIASWVNLYVGGNYDATVLISSVKDNQVNCIVSLFVVTDVLYLVRVVMVVFDCADGPLTGWREESRQYRLSVAVTDSKHTWMIHRYGLHVCVSHCWSFKC